MAWLLCDGRVAASLEVAGSFPERLRGLLGRESLDGAYLITRTSSVHTFGMQFPIDVAFVDSDMLVYDIITMVPWRVSRPRRHARCVVEAPAGAFERWGVNPGSKLEVRA